MLGGLIGSVFGVASKAASSAANPTFSAWLGDYFTKRAQRRSYDYYLRSLHDSPLAQRQGFKAAGYNPMLALGNLGSSSFSASSSPSFAPMGNFDLVGSAREGARFVNDIARGIKLENEKKELENANLESDLDTKEVQRSQMEANSSLLESQTDRTDLAYGRDIVDTAVDIAGTAGSLYSAKAMRDVAKSPQETITTIHHGDKTKPTEIIKSRGRPAVDSSAKPKSSSAAPLVGSSAMSVGSVARDVAKQLLLLAPAFFATDAAIRDYKGNKRIPKHHERMYKDKPFSWSPLR